MRSPSLQDVIAACREPEWPTAAEIRAVIESGREHNAHAMVDAPAAKKVNRASKTGDMPLLAYSQR